MIIILPNSIIFKYFRETKPVQAKRKGAIDDPFGDESEAATSSRLVKL